MTLRPPIGFIVEGHGEYNCYPSLFCRVVDGNGLFVPRVNAGGCGSIVRNLSEQLTDLFLTISPLSVIITVDLEDVLKQNLADSCVELLQNLNEQIEAWKLSAAIDERLQPLPERIVCVVQVKKFESWLISDINGLKDSGLLGDHLTQPQDAEQLFSPSLWLRDNLLVDGCVKNPAIAKSIISALDPEIMRLHSRSFDKFFRECLISYNEWEQYILDNEP